MEKLTQKISARHDREMEALTYELTRGRNEINNSLNELEGWADRVMGQVLKPAGTDAILWYDCFRTKRGNGAVYKREY